MKKEIIIITDKAHNKPILELLENWGFYTHGVDSVNAEIIYLNGSEWIGWSLFSELKNWVEYKNSTIHLSSDILSNPSIVGTFEGAKQMEEPLSNFNKLALLLSECVHNKCIIAVPHDIGIDLANTVNDFYNEICKTYSTPLKPQFQLTRSWIDKQAHKCFDGLGQSFEFRFGFKMGIEIVAKELGLTIKEDK